MLVLVALARVTTLGTPLDEAGYATLASFDLKPVMDFAVAVTTDATGNVFVLGNARTAAAGAHRLGVGGATDVVVAKFSPAGELFYVTIVGGEGDDYPDRFFIDAQGHVSVRGYSGSTNFPLRNALHSTPGVYQSPFLCRITPDGTSLVYSTFLDGTVLPWYAIAVLPDGDAILAGAGQGASSNPFNTDSDALVVRLGEFGSNIVFSTSIGGSSSDQVTAVALDASGAIWVAGRTASPDFPVTADAAQPYLTLPEESTYIYESDAFLVKLADDGVVLYSTFWGTEHDDWISKIAFRNDGALFVVRSAWPTFTSELVYSGGSDSPFQPTLPPVIYGPREFLTLLNPHTGQTISEAPLPTASYNVVNNLAIDSNGNAAFVGFLGGKDYLAQFEPAYATFRRFAIFDDCNSIGVSGPALNLADDLWLAVSKFGNTDEANETTLFKVTHSLPPPNLRPFVTLNPYSSGSLASPGLGRSEPEPPKITPVAVDIDGNIQQVQLFADGTLLAVMTNSPYSYVWSNAPYGEHPLIAIATDNLDLSSTSCPTSLIVHGPPPNDSFYRSIAISGMTLTVNGSTAGATREPGELEGSFGYESSSVWWCWRAPSDGTFSIHLDKGADAHELAVFTGLDLTRLQSLGNGRTVSFQATAGKAYYICVVNSWFTIPDYESGEYVLVLQPAASPPNDNFADRLELSGVPLTVQGHNFNATFEPGLNVPGGDDFSSVWWTWTAPTGGFYRAVTVSTNPYSAWLRVVSTNMSGGFPPPLPFGGSTSVVWRAAADEPFYIRVSGLETVFQLQIYPVGLPPNDNMANAILLSGFPVSVTGSLLGATREPNEPVHTTYGTSLSSVWFRWTAPSNASVVMDVNSDNYGGLIAVYSGHPDAFVLETRTAGNDLPARFHVVGGREYWIAIDSVWGGTGDFTFIINPRTYPPNDDFAQRTPVTTGGYGSNAEASFEAIEAGYLTDGEEATIWYSWFAPADGDYTLVTHSSGFDGRAAVFRLEESGDLVHVAGRSNVNSRLLQFTATAGTEYQIAFISRQSYGGSLAFRIRPSHAPANDDYANAAALFGASVYVQGSNVDATIEPGELDPFAYDTLGASVWWKWIAPHSGLFVVSLARHTMSADLAIYRGTELSNRVSVTRLYGLSGSSLIEVTAGEEYRIGVYGRFDVYSWFEQQGDFTLAITPIQPPPNDNFANATVLHSSPAEVTGTTLGATPEGTESSPSVWWRWTAPASQLTSLRVSIDRPLEVFTGTSLQTLTYIAGSSNWYSPSSLAFEAEAGTTYYIRVSGYAFATFTLTLKGPPTFERPTISALTRTENGSIQFIIDALIGSTNIVESSADLLNWSPISTNLTDCFPYPFTAPTSSQPHQFYRARLMPQAPIGGGSGGIPPRPGRLPQ